MFDLIRNLEKEDATELIHYLVSMLNKAKNETDYEIEINNSNKILEDKEIMVIGDTILDSIGFNEDLDEEILDKYIIELYHLLQELVTSNRSLDLERGKKLLEDLNNNKDL